MKLPSQVRMDRLMSELDTFSQERCPAFSQKKVTEFTVSLSLTYDESYINEDPLRLPNTKPADLSEVGLTSIELALSAVRMGKKHVGYSLLGSTTRDLDELPVSIISQLSPKKLNKYFAKNHNMGEITETLALSLHVDTRDPEDIDIDSFHEFSISGKEVFRLTSDDILNNSEGEIIAVPKEETNDSTTTELFVPDAISVEAISDDVERLQNAVLFNEIVSESGLDYKVSFMDYNQSARTIRAILKAIRSGSPQGF